MGSSKFEMNLPAFFEKKTIGGFNLDEKLFEFSDYLLIDKCDFNAHIVIEKKNTFWQLDIKVNGFVNTYCDRCGDPLVLNLKGKDVYFLKKEQANNKSHNIINITHSDQPLNVEHVLKETIFFLFPKKRIHNKKKCNLETLEKLEVYQKKENTFFLSDHLKAKLK